MSKKSSKSAFFAEQRKQKIQKERELKQRKALIKKGGITLACVVALVLVTVLCVQLVLNSGVLLRSTVIKGEHFSVTKGMMSYYIYEQYETFLNYYGSSLDQMSFDKDKSLKKQNYKEGMTFFEFFADNAYDNAQSYMYYCEAAYKAGYDISEEKKQAVRERVEALDPAVYGRGVTTEDMYNAMYLGVLAAEYNAVIYEENVPSLEDIEKYLEDNTTACQYVDYLVYSVKYAKDDKSAESKAKETADAIAQCTTVEDFKKAIIKHYTDGKITEIDEKDENVIKVLTQAEKSKASYTDNDLGDWLFREAKKLDTTVIQDTTKNCYNVYMLLSEPALDMQKTVDVRHVLVSYEDFDSKEAAKAEAERIYALYNGGSEKDFALLATRYSSDTGSYSVGGLYKRVQKGSMVEEFDAWCFDSSRKAGDTAIVATGYGYHVMYFVSDNLLNWQLKYFEDTAASASSDAYKEIMEKNPIEEKQNKIYSIPERKY